MPAPFVAGVAARAGFVAARSAAKALRSSQEGTHTVHARLRRKGSLRSASSAALAIDTTLGGLSVYLPDKMHYSPNRDPLPIGVVFLVNEYGGGNVPARPALGAAMAQRGPSWLRSATSRMAMAIRGRVQGLVTMSRLGSQIVEDIRRSYESWRRPPNAARTVQRKGVDDPLVDSGVLAQSFDYAWSAGRRRLRGLVHAIKRLDRIR